MNRSLRQILNLLEANEGLTNDLEAEKRQVRKLSDTVASQSDLILELQRQVTILRHENTEILLDHLSGPALSFDDEIIAERRVNNPDFPAMYGGESPRSASEPIIDLDEKPQDYLERDDCM